MPVAVELRWFRLHGLSDQIRALRDIQIPMDGLVSPVEQAVREGNRRRAEAGLDRFGEPLAPIAEATVKWRKKVGKGMGPPLAPDGDSSRTVGGLDAVVIRVVPNDLVMTMVWFGIPWLGAHTTGHGRLPVRDIEGLTPEGWSFVYDIFDEYVRLRVDEALDDIFLGGGPAASFASPFTPGGGMRDFRFGMTFFA